MQFRNLRGENLTFLTSPNKGSQTIAGQSVVVSDREKALALYKAMAADKMTEWMAANQAEAVDRRPAAEPPSRANGDGSAVHTGPSLSLTLRVIDLKRT